MALGCSGTFSNMMTWIVNNQAADQGGVFTTNIKAVIGVGDCTHLTSSGEFAHGATAAIVTHPPTTPAAGVRLVMLGATLTVKIDPLLTAFPTVTTTLPVVAPAGIGATMPVALQFVGVATVPLKVTVLVPWPAPKFAPAIVTDPPTAPAVRSS